MKNITVIGAGTMGNGIAHTFAQKGFNVNLVDISADALEKAINTIKGNLNRMVQKEKITEEENIVNAYANFTTELLTRSNLKDYLIHLMTKKLN